MDLIILCLVLPLSIAVMSWCLVDVANDVQRLMDENDDLREVLNVQSSIIEEMRKSHEEYTDTY